MAPSIRYRSPSFRSSISTRGSDPSAMNLSMPKWAKASGKSDDRKLPVTNWPRVGMQPSLKAAISSSAAAAVKRNALGTFSSSNTILSAAWSPLRMGMATCARCMLMKALMPSASVALPSYLTVPSSKSLSTYTPSPFTPSLDITSLLVVCAHAAASRMLSASDIHSSVFLPTKSSSTFSFSLRDAALSALSRSIEAGPALFFRCETMPLASRGPS
mmetsp:Transcript_50537/g.123244  ORF Transcript_50537/g.123244 Transcript_50537/m.123244 type:complete len:216 (+) Transcript_50537:825-1472(+)